MVRLPAWAHSILAGDVMCRRHLNMSVKDARQFPGSLQSGPWTHIHLVARVCSMGLKGDNKGLRVLYKDQEVRPQTQRVRVRVCVLCREDPKGAVVWGVKG